MEVTIVDRIARPTGEPPRCRQCGAVAHAPTNGHPAGAFDRVCGDCVRAMGPCHADPAYRRRELSVVAWALGWPFVVPALNGREAA